jgi:hypothetical protein
MIRLAECKRFCRPLIGIVVAYAVAAQSLLIALGGFALPAHANNRAPAFELCLHDSQGAPELPADDADHSACSHCILCVAGSHLLVIENPPVVFHRVDIEIAASAWVTNSSGSPALPDYSIASPRGPPLRA